MVWLHGGLEIMGYVLGQFAVIMGNHCCALPLARSLYPTLFGPLWANPAEILRGKRARVWLQTMQIMLGCVKVRERSG